MSDFTRHDQAGSSGTDSTMTSMGGDHSSSHSMPSSGMSMVFHTRITDSLYSSAWAPTTPAQYIGTVIFLVLLAFTYRFLVAWKSVLDHKWSVRDNERRVLVAAGKAGSMGSLGELGGSDGASGEGGRGKDGWHGRPWRWSVDLPRAWMQMVISGVGYLLMLAVMTFNVGYFLAVLAGVFFGELIFGRWIRGSEH